ncbi:MAG: hypothetical protein JAZ15_11790 [Candidatus Thiodiazotropha endolucinida]|nr:hypothetical protein [Candidatus Thiodiazotropha taylori]MCW4313703.1 hypothetical protein [Candidatus Thiodiazotropha taylori]
MVPSTKQWKNWSLPSKLTAIGTLVGVLSFCAYIVEKGYGVSKYLFQQDEQVEDVNVVVEFNNKELHPVSVFNRGEVFFWHPGGGGYHEIYTFQMVWPNNTTEANGNLLVPTGKKVRALLKILPTEIARHYYDQGHMDVSLHVKTKNGTQFSQPTAYSKKNLEGAYIPIEFGEKS